MYPQTCRKILNLVIGAALLLHAHARALAADDASAPPPPPAGASATNNDQERNFYQVLEDVVGDFEYDLKNGNVNGMKDVAFRNIATSENIPPSFKSHLELLITERILRTTKTRVIQCLPCRAKKTIVQGDQIVVTSPETNPAELSRIAKVSGIENFLDVVFSYQPTGIVLSMTITQPDSGSIIWSRSYNSETSRAAAFRRGVDFSQADDARKSTEYAPAIAYRATVYFAFEPNLNSTTGCLGLGLRAVERYDNRKKEVGFELDYFKDASTLAGSVPATAGTVNLYDGLNLTLLFLHAWNLIGEEENYNKPRASVLLGIGGTYASGYLGGLIRGQYEYRLGKHYTISGTLGYRPSSTAFLDSTAAGTISGLEYALGISLIF